MPLLANVEDTARKSLAFGLFDLFRILFFHIGEPTNACDVARGELTPLKAFRGSHSGFAHALFHCLKERMVSRVGNVPSKRKPRSSMYTRAATFCAVMGGFFPSNP